MQNQPIDCDAEIIDCDAEVIDCDNFGSMSEEDDSMEQTVEEMNRIIADADRDEFRVREAIYDMWNRGMKISLERACYNGTNPLDLELETIYNNLDNFEKQFLDRMYYEYLKFEVVIRPLSAVPQEQLKRKIWELYHSYILDFFYGNRKIDDN